MKHKSLIRVYQFFRNSLFSLMMAVPLFSHSQYVPDGPIVTADCEFNYCFELESIVPAPVYADADSVYWNFDDGTSFWADAEEDYMCYMYDVSSEYTPTITVVTSSGTYNYTLGTFHAYSTQDGGNIPYFSAVENDGTFDFIHNAYPWVYFSNINFGDGTTSAIGTSLTPGGVFASHTYSEPGTYTVTLTVAYVQHPWTSCEWSYSIEVKVDPCCTNFAPEEGKRYWISGWIEEAHPSQVKNYENAFIEVEFVGSSGLQKKQFWSSGDIIDNWQRIVGDFEIPSGTTDLKINLINQSSSVEAYFDDIRVHPFEASMKSYVYDPITLWLTAELDDNNYATFYEYDHEGQLIRIKKETARGIMTIQESRSSNPKKAN